MHSKISHGMNRMSLMPTTTLSSPPKTLSGLFCLGESFPAPSWMPLYDLAAYLAQANTKWANAPEKMAALAYQSVQLEEYQAVLDLCMAFQPRAFAGHSRYRATGGRADIIEHVLVENARLTPPSYWQLLMLLIDRGALI